MSAYELAQLNVGVIKGPMDSPVMADFPANLEWFERMSEAYLVLWWVRCGHRPSVTEALARLELLRTNGPSAEAFTFRHAFPPPGAAQDEPSFEAGSKCPAT